MINYWRDNSNKEENEIPEAIEAHDYNDLSSEKKKAKLMKE